MKYNEEGVILITGANGGIGSEVVDYLISIGIRNIACHYHKSNKQLASVLHRHGILIEDNCFNADLTIEDEVINLKKNIEKKMGNVWGLINMAGGSSNGMSWNLDINEFKRIIDINLLSTFLCSKIFIPSMREKQKGRIINISSIVASSGIIGASHYCAAKAGVIGLTKALALELANKNICVNTIALGYFNVGLIEHIPEDELDALRGQIPLKRFGLSGEVGGLIFYLLSKEAQYITGQVLHINGGLYL